ncbi:unnamed protein product, partial [Ixodes persulcatus]
FDVSRCPDLVPEASRCRHRSKDDVHRGCHRTHERAGAPLARLAQPMVVVHEVELLDERARPPYLHHPQLSAGQGTVPLAHHHARQLKLPGGASSLPRHQQLPSAPYHDANTEDDDDDDDEDDDDLPEYAEAGPPTGHPPSGLALIDRHPYLCPASGSAHRRSLPAHDPCDTTSSSVPLDKKTDRFTACSALFTVVSLLSYAADVGSDTAACYFLYLEGNLWWFGLTLAVTVIPAVTVNAFSLRWYMHDDRESRASAKEVAGGAAAPVHRPRMGVLGWTLRILFHLAFLGPVVRYIDLLVYGLRSRSREKRSRQRQQQWHLTPVRLEQPRSQQVDYYLLMIHEDRDTALLALLESFMQSAPQLVLQLYILSDRYDLRLQADALTVASQLASVGSSLFELCWSLASYHRALRRSVPDKQNMSRLGSALQFLWRLGTVAARSAALSLFASQYKYWLFPACIGHWGVMTVWVMHQGTRFCDGDSGRPRPCREYLFNMLIGAIYLFCFLNVKV